MITPEALISAENAFHIEAECLEELKARFSAESFSDALRLLLSAERIGASGCGHSGIACRHFAHLMRCIELSASFIPPSEAVHGGMGLLKPGDAMLLVSRGGKTAELLPIAEICRKKSIKIITVTENLDSELARGSDAVLRLYVNRETDKYNAQGTTSFLATCAIFDALQSELIELKGYKSEAFALIHPGGAVGERLNSRSKET